MPDKKVEPRAVAQEGLRQAGLMKGMRGDLKSIINHAVANDLEVTPTGGITIPGVFDESGGVLLVAQIVMVEGKNLYLVT